MKKEYLMPIINKILEAMLSLLQSDDVEIAKNAAYFFFEFLLLIGSKLLFGWSSQWLAYNSNLFFFKPFSVFSV